MGFAVGSIGAVLAPVLLIVALVGGLYLGFKKLQDSLGPGAGIIDTLKVAMLYFVDFLSMIVNGITFIPRKMIGFLGKRAAKWLLGDDFDTSALDAISEGLDTGRGARAAAEIRKKNEEQAAYNEARDSGMSKEEAAEMSAMANMTEDELLAAIEKKTTVDGAAISQSSADLQADQATTASNVSVSTVTSAPTTTNNQVIQSNVTHMLPSAASAVLGGASSR